MSSLILPASAASDLGTPNIRTSTSHKVYTWRKLKFWAQGGRIHIVNEQDGEHSSCSWREFAERALILSDAVKKLPYSDEREAHQHLGFMQEACCKEALHQGDPHNPKVLGEMLRSGPKRQSFGGFHSGTGRVGDLIPRYPDGKPFRPLIAGGEATRLMTAPLT